MCRPILNTDVLGMWAALTPLPLRSPLAFPFLHDPQGMVKGTKMDFSGLKDDEEIKPCSPIWRRLIRMGWCQNEAIGQF